MGRIKIECFDKKIKLRKIEKAVYTVLGQVSHFLVELVFQDGEGITALNRNTRNVDSITDVLSYPSLDGIKGKILLPKDCPTEMEGKYIFLGSIVLCEEKILELVTRKPIYPSESEINENPPSRSAKLRIAQKV